MLRIDPASRVPASRALPIPERPGQAVTGLALAPDAARIAVTAGPVAAPALHVFAVATGAERVRDGPGAGPGSGPGAGHGSLSWTADGRTLALIRSAGPPDSGVRLLDTAAPGSSLLASSRLVVPAPTDPANWPHNYRRQAMISADGQVIIAVIQVDTQDETQPMGGISHKLLTFLAETGTLLRTLNHILVRGGYQQVLWASPSAQLLIISGTQPGPTVGSFNLGHSAGILGGGRFTPLPWSTRTFAAAWQH